MKVVRLSRGFIGPFWFPGLTLPEWAPKVLRDTLVLQLFQEVVGTDVQDSGHRDPLVPAREELHPPEGMQLYRERCLAVPKRRVEAVQSWAQQRGGSVVVPMG